MLLILLASFSLQFESAFKIQMMINQGSRLKLTRQNRRKERSCRNEYSSLKDKTRQKRPKKESSGTKAQFDEETKRGEIEGQKYQKNRTADEES